MTPAAGTCTCAQPIPVQKAARKGAARTICARCGQPVPLTLTGGSRSAA
jgi:hypothetical protein